MIWYIAFGSAVGGASRFLLGRLIQERLGTGFPINTLIINVTGSFLLGFLMRSLLDSSSVGPNVRALLTTGFCGGYTTFSTYSFETASLIEDGQYPRAALYVGLSVGLALLGTFAGFAVSKNTFSLRERI